MASILLISPIFTDFILPFILVFVLLFAIMQKTKLLGDEAQRANLIISMVVGIILIATPFARDIVVQLMPFLAVFAVILLVFMLLYGFITGNKTGDVLNKGLKITFGIILGIALIIALLMITGYWDVLIDYVFNGSSGGYILVNALLIIAVIGAVWAVLAGAKKS